MEYGMVLVHPLEVLGMVLFWLGIILLAIGIILLVVGLVRGAIQT